MNQTVINIEELNLPLFITEKLGNQEVLVREVPDGILLSPVKKDSGLRGKYKGKFTTEQYLKQKRADKEMEL